MVSLKNIRGKSRVSRTRSAPTATTARVSRSARPSSAPARINLNKESILGMTKTQARQALRSTTPMTFYRKGRAGLILWALLLIAATQPASGFGLRHNFAVPTNSAPVKAKHWWEAFHAKETSTATQIAQQATILGTAYATGSGTATGAVALGQFTSTAYGKYVVVMTIIAFLIHSILQYGQARMMRQTQREQLSMLDKQMAHQAQMMQMLMNSQVASPRGRRRRVITANSVARLAITAN